MFALIFALQTASAPLKPLSPRDSATLATRVRNATFQWMMDWRILWLGDHLPPRTGTLDTAMALDPRPGVNVQFGRLALDSMGKTSRNYRPGFDLKLPAGDGCEFQGLTRDYDRHHIMSHLIPATERPKLSLCPVWAPPNWDEPLDEAKAIDDALVYQQTFDKARAQRARVLATLDSAAKKLPGDDWIAGQRVRLYFDQQDTVNARRAASDAQCGGSFWWCFALQGYVEFRSGKSTAASAAFDMARKMMPDSIRCAWDDVGLFFTENQRAEYNKKSCAEREAINARTWWLADPLFLERGNERRAEQYARHVLVDIHRGLPADERFDWRDLYQGPALTEMVLRYGWPTDIQTHPVDTIRWRPRNTLDLFLGDPTITTANWNDGLTVDCGPPPPANRPVVATVGARGDVRIDHPAPRPARVCPREFVRQGVRYWGPQYHTVPNWETVLDPFHATDAGWDLAPERDGPYWDTSWWPFEFYRRDAGPLLPLTSQVAFFRRQATAVMMSAMTWDSTHYLADVPRRVIGAALLSTGPDAPFTGARDTMPAARPHPLVSTVASGSALLSLEFLSPDGVGAAGRSRFGVIVPPPLSALTGGTLALSDVVLATADSGGEAPGSMVELLPRMLATTAVRNPKRIAFFWEVYGGRPGDTLDVAIRIVRIDDPNTLRRAAEIFGITRELNDSVVQTWREPRAGDPVATADGGTTIRPRGIQLDVSALSEGRYSMEVIVRRGVSTPVSSRREFSIVR